MSTIDTQNAKSIRDPMLIEVKLSAQDSAEFTASEYSFTPKIAEYDDIQDEWTMRALADLQGDGFPLDGSCELYDSSVVSSAANGKIGIRGGAFAYGSTSGTVGVSVTASDMIYNLAISVTGCRSINCNGTAYVVQGNTALIPFNASSGTLVFYQSEGYQRIEIQYIKAGVYLTFDNENIISCEVNLRADLKPIDPTLPESEIELKAYYSEDVSALSAKIMEDQPITYQAGYEDDMSPVRTFYMDKPIDWQDNILTIHGVDAVHFLDEETEPIFIGQYWTDLSIIGPNKNQAFASTVNNPHQALYRAMKDQLDMASIEIEAETEPAATYSSATAGKYIKGILERQPRRAVIANMMNLLHHDYTTGYFNGLDAFWLTYVDAGIPTLTWSKPSSIWSISESDCGDVKRNYERKIIEIDTPCKSVRVHSNYARITKSTTDAPVIYAQNIGSAEIVKNEGISLSFDSLANRWWFVAARDSVPYGEQPGSAYDYVDGWDGYTLDSDLRLPAGASKANSYGQKLFDESAFYDWTAKAFAETGITPMTPKEVWRNLINGKYVDSNTNSYSGDLYGSMFEIIDSPKVYTTDGIGITAQPTTTKWCGTISAGRYGYTDKRLNLLPKKGFTSLLERSNVTGSFTWKGDPRMQPRDVFTFSRLDGTTEDCTIETISLKHEKGGLVSEITYRKGIV